MGHKRIGALSFLRDRVVVRGKAWDIQSIESSKGGRRVVTLWDGSQTLALTGNVNAMVAVVARPNTPAKEI